MIQPLEWSTVHFPWTWCTATTLWQICFSIFGFGSLWSLEQDLKWSRSSDSVNLCRNVGYWRNPVVSQPAMGYLQGWHPVYLAHEAAGRPRRSRLGFICAGKACPIEFWLQICCTLELVTRMEWIVLNGSWCDSPGEALLPLPNGLNLAWCEKKAGHLLPQGDQSLADYSRDNSKMCSQPLHSAHWALYDIPPLSFIIWNGSKTFHRASVSRVGVKQLRQLMDGLVSLSRVMTEAKRSQEFFLILIPDESWKLRVDRSPRDALHPNVPISAGKMTPSCQSHRLR